MDSLMSNNQLKEIHVDDLNHVTMRTLLPMLDKLPRLEKLWIYWMDVNLHDSEEMRKILAPLAKRPSPTNKCSIQLRCDPPHVSEKQFWNDPDDMKMPLLEMDETEIAARVKCALEPLFRSPFALSITSLQWSDPSIIDPEVVQEMVRIFPNVKILEWNDPVENYKSTFDVSPIILQAALGWRDLQTLILVDTINPIQYALVPNEIDAFPTYDEINGLFEELFPLLYYMFTAGRSFSVVQKDISPPYSEEYEESTLYFIAQSQKRWSQLITKWTTFVENESVSSEDRARISIVPIKEDVSTRIESKRREWSDDA